MNKENVYYALGIIEGTVCTAQKNTREMLMKAVEMIKDAIKEPVCTVVEEDVDK